MFLRRIEADGFLSFGEPITLDVGPGLTVITGPNGSGKSNVARCLDLGRVVLERSEDNDSSLAGRLELYKDAGYEGQDSFTVKLSIEIDQEWERHLIWLFVCTSFVHSSASHTRPDRLTDVQIRDVLIKESLAPLWSGSLIIHRPPVSTMPLSAVWEFTVGQDVWHVSLANVRSALRKGTAVFELERPARFDFAGLLQKGRRENENIDFREALQSGEEMSDFSAEYRGSGMTQSLQELSSELGVDPDNNAYGFDQVLSTVLGRGLVLTDNRRLPLRRQFAIQELGYMADLRDGAAVAAELYRLKNGYDNERARFEEIRATFKGLTGRELDVRSRPTQLNDGKQGMIIEPTVAGLHGERLVELSGAGIQEALLISVLLHGEAGRIVVLDEPAVNLEPTVQRRLIEKIRGPGQHIVITHSADLVPVEEAQDLDRIVRIAPGRSGSQVWRWQFSGLDRGQLFRQLNLMEPTHVRGLLFAAGVILCEGPTEVGVLPRWWRNSPRVGLPDPQSANVPIISVDGDGGFGAYIRYVDAFGIPWAIIADGPTLRPGSKLTRQLYRFRYSLKDQPGQQESFARWREFWENQGVFTLADRFGDDGSKSGEFEAYLQKVDQALFTQVQAEVGRQKPRVGACFADSHPDAPVEVLDLYKKIAARLGINAIV